MKDNLCKLATAVVVLTMLVPGLTMLLAGCGPKVTPTSVPMKPTATPVPAALPTDTPVPPPAETEEAGVLIDDFEGGDFDDRWWFHTNEEADPSTNMLRANFVFRAFCLKYRSSSGHSRNTA